MTLETCLNLFLFSVSPSYFPIFNPNPSIEKNQISELKGILETKSKPLVCLCKQFIFFSGARFSFFYIEI